MAKTKEELKQLQNELVNLGNKLGELSEEELSEITGGDFLDILKKISEGIHSTTKPVVKGSALAIGKNNDDCNSRHDQDVLNW